MWKDRWGFSLRRFWVKDVIVLEFSEETFPPKAHCSAWFICGSLCLLRVSVRRAQFTFPPPVCLYTFTHHKSMVVHTCSMHTHGHRHAQFHSLIPLSRICSCCIPEDCIRRWGQNVNLNLTHRWDDGPHSIHFKHYVFLYQRESDSCCLKEASLPLISLLWHSNFLPETFFQVLDLSPRNLHIKFPGQL